MTADIDKRLELSCALLRIADNSNACTDSHLRDAGPKVGANHCPVLAREFLNSLIGDRVKGVIEDRLAIGIAAVGNQPMRGIPGILFRLAAHNLQAHAKA